MGEGQQEGYKCFDGITKIVKDEKVKKQKKEKKKNYEDEDEENYFGMNKYWNQFKWKYLRN